MAEELWTQEEQFAQRAEVVKSTLIVQLGCMGVVTFGLSSVLGTSLAGVAGLKSPSRLWSAHSSRS